MRWFGLIIRCCGIFTTACFSYEAGSSETIMKIFKIALLSLLEAVPIGCFFTDDILINVEAARKHGMDAVQFQTQHSLRRNCVKEKSSSKNNKQECLC